MAIGLDQAIATKSILFIDPTIENYQSLIGGLTAENRQDACSTKIVVLDAYRDGIEQISETLARNKGLKAVHILSHGGPGCLYLGNSQLSNETVERYNSQLRQWGETLGENADILLYGCNVGADLAFVRQLRKLTGANIAASATSTGNAALGGDWNLEVRVGEVSTPLAFESATMEAYNGVLNRLFAVKDDGSNLIVELNPSTGAEINSFSTPDGLLAAPQGLAFDGSSLFIVDNGSPHTLFELDPDTGAVRDYDTISGMVTVEGLAALDGKVYLLDSNANDIIEFDPIGDIVTNTLDIDNGIGPSVYGGLAGITGPNALLAISEYSDLLQINPSTGEIVYGFPLPWSWGSTASGIAAIDNEIYVAYDNGSSVIEVFDRYGESQRIIDNLPYFSALGGDDIVEGVLYFSEDSAMDGNGLYSLDTATGASTLLGESDSYAYGANAGLAPSQDTRSLYGSQGYNLLTVSSDGSGVVSFSENSNLWSLEGLAYDYMREVLYGIEGSSFFILSQNTGNTTQLNSPPTSSLQALAYGNGGIYALGGDQNLFFYSLAPSDIFGPDNWSIVGDTGQVWPNAGLAFDPFKNVLYAKSSEDTFLYQIDPSDATTTQIGDTGSDKGGGLAFSFPNTPPPQEPNDTFSLASHTGLTRSNYGSFSYSGEIGDNPNSPSYADVDLFHVDLGRGDRLAVTLSGSVNVTIFDANGNYIQEPWSFFPTPVQQSTDTNYFTAPLSGSYYLSIEGPGFTDTYDLTLETTNTTKQRLFAISSVQSNKIIELEPTTGTVVNRFDAPTTLNGSEELAFDGDRLFFIHDNTLYELDSNSGQVIDSDEIYLENPPGPWQPTPILAGLAVLGGKVYRFDNQNSRIIEFNPLTSTVTNTVDIDLTNTDIFLEYDLAAITEPDALLLSESGQILEVDPTTGEITTSFSVGWGDLAVINNEVYVNHGDSIEVFNRSGESQRTINLPEGISALGSDDVPSGGEPILYFHRDAIPYDPPYSTDNLYSLNLNNGTPTLLGISQSDDDNVGLAPSSNPELLYYATPYSLVKIDTDTGSPSLSGINLGVDSYFYNANGLAYDRNNDLLYGISSTYSNSFFSFDASTPESPPSPLASPPTSIDGLAFGNSGVYGVGSDQKLWFYDPSTNSWNEIGNTGQNWSDVGLAFDSNNNVLYAKGGQDTFLYEIDVSNAQTTAIGDTGFQEGGGLAFVIPPNTPTEAKDTISQASATGLTLDNHGVFTYSGEIGDNNNVAPESDVDIFQFQLGVEEEVQFSLPDIFDETGMTVGYAEVRLFDSNGEDLSMFNPSGFSDLWEETEDSKPYGSYTTTEAGTFYLGISVENNFSYNVNSEGSGSGDADKLGSYSLTIETIDRPMGTDEPNDTLADALATGLTLDSPGSYSYAGEIGDNTNNILPELDVDLFKFDLDIGEEVRFPFVIDLLDQYGYPIGAGAEGRLFDSTGISVIDWTTDPNDPNVGIYRTDEAGTFYLGVSAEGNYDYDPNTEGSGSAAMNVGNYNLTIETIGRTMGDDEPNDTLTDATDTGLTSATPGVFTYSGEIGDNTNVLQELDVDLFKFDLGLGEQVRFPDMIDLLDETGMPMGGGTVKLFDSTGMEVMDGTSDPSTNERMYQSDVGGTYYIGVSGVTTYDPTMEGSGDPMSAMGTGNYNLNIETIGRTMGDDEPNDTLTYAVATGLTLDNPGSYSYTGEIGDNTNILPALDVDLFEFELDIGETVRFNLPERRDELGNLIAETQVQLFDADGNPVTWEPDGLDYGQFTAENAGTFYLGVSDVDNGNYYPTTEGSGYDSSNYLEGGTYELTIEKTTQDNMSIFSEDFNSFTGSGFAPTPTAGQLDSDNWKVTGSLADGDGTFGGTHDSGDFARGISTGGVPTGGVYAFEIGTGDNILGLQPTDDDYTPGDIVLKVTNNTGSTITDFNVAYDIFYNNNEERANSLNFAWSVDDASYTEVSELDFTTPEASDALGWQSESQTTTISGLSIANGSDFYLRWQGDDVSGTGFRDEYGIDNLVVVANPPVVETFSPADDGTDIAVDANLVINFNENVQKGSTGDIVIKQVSDDSVIETIDVTSGLVSIAGSEVTINPTSDLAGETGYYVEIAAGAIEDTAGNDYAGISGNSTWNFTTAGAVAPEPTLLDYNGDGTRDLLWRHSNGELRVWLMENGDLKTPIVLPNRESAWTVESVANFDSDADSDILWKHTDGRVRLWVMENGDLQTPVTLPDRNGWTVEGVADFDGDSDNDILWRNTSGEVRAWVMENGDLQTPVTLPDRDTGWTVEKVANFDSDSDKDILWKHTDGRVRLWVMENGGLQTPVTLPDRNGWTVEGVADFDGDSDNDVLWRDTSGEVRAWVMENGDLQTPVTLPDRESGWTVEKVTNFDSDSDNDILWKHTDGRARVWLMENGDLQTPVALPDIDPLLGIENVSDFDGDGDDDILLRYDDGRARMWRVENGDVQEVFFLPERTSSWQLEQVSNFDSDSDSDVLWRNSSDGRVRLWQFENADFASTNSLADRDSNWELVQSEFLG